MGSNLGRSNGAAERGGGSCASLASTREEPVPDFRRLLRRAANDLRTEATGRVKAEQRDRLLKLAALLEGYAEEAR